jgi:Ca2+-transporting ATPase
MVVFLIDSQPEPARVARHAIAARRLRLEVPGLLGNKYLGRRLERTIETWPGVQEAKAEPRSGRVLVRYAPGAPLLGRLKEQPEPSREPEPKRRAVPSAAPWRPQEPWHALDTAQVLGLLRSGPGGLTSEQAAEQLRVHGLNLVEEVGQRSPLAILGAQVANVPMGLLLGSAAASLLAGDRLEAAAILVVVGVNAGIGYRIESHNQELLSSWRKLEAGMVQALRGGVLLPVPTAELVPGDVLLCRAGDVLPADVRVLEAHRLSCDESPLTGESEPQPKQAAAVEEGAPLASREYSERTWNPPGPRDNPDSGEGGADEGVHAAGTPLGRWYTPGAASRLFQVQPPQRAASSRGCSWRRAERLEPVSLRPWTRVFITSSSVTNSV